MNYAQLIDNETGEHPARRPVQPGVAGAKVTLSQVDFHRHHTSVLYDGPMDLQRIMHIGHNRISADEDPPPFAPVTGPATDPS